MDHPNTNKSNPTMKLDDKNNYFSLSSDFLLLNGDGGSGFGFDKAYPADSDIEMIALQEATYTSLKDLLPPTSTSPAATSPSAQHSSWQEIPIKNPLVKQAALAYLQPMSSPPPESGDKGMLGRLMDGCWQCECFSWVNDVVLMGLREVFCWREADDEEVYNKVD